MNAFTLSPTRWIEATNAIGIVSQAGRYGGTFAQTDIAFEFASWISVEFRLYLVMEFQRLKAKEQAIAPIVYRGSSGFLYATIVKAIANAGTTILKLRLLNI